MMGDINQFYNVFLQTFQAYKKVEKEIHEITPEVNHAEIHLIEAIREEGGASITALARRQGVSKSAVSQMVSKLVKKGFVHKKVSPQAENTVILTLTPSGERICEAHAKVHMDIYRKMQELFEDYPAGTEDTVMAVLTDLQEAWLSLK